MQLTEDFVVYNCDPTRKISAIKFLRAATEARDGQAASVRDTKRAVENLPTIPVVICNVPVRLFPVLKLAAAAKGVVVDYPDAGDRTYL